MTIQELHKLVWDFRREMENYFPTPNREDSLAFAFTEIGEAVDAQLRQNPIYKRNNTKEHSVERELAQCAMMLLTAAGEEGLRPDFEGYRQDVHWTLRQIAWEVGDLYGDPDCDQRTDCFWAVSAITTLIDLPLHLAAELERMRLRHGPARDTGPASHNEVANEHIIEFTYPQSREGLTLADYTEGCTQ